MEVKKNLPSDILDIIFDQRNKDYGAYELRKNYERRAKCAVFGMLLFSFVAVSIPLLAGIIGTKPPRVMPLNPTDTIVFKTIEQQKQEPKKTPESTQYKTKSKSKPPIEMVRAKDIPKEKEPIDLPKDDTPSYDRDNGEVASNTPNGNGSGSDKGDGNITTKQTEAPEPDITYTPEIGVEEYPEYPGGEDALIAYLASKIKYPPNAIANNIEGKVVLGFVVNKNGEIDELKVVRSLGYGCDEEAMRVVKSMPLWKPGKNNKKPVRVYFNLPIEFQIAQ